MTASPDHDTSALFTECMTGNRGNVPPGPLQFARARAMDTEHVRSGAALEGRPARRYNPGGISLPGVDGEVAAPAPQPRYSEANDPKLASYLRVEVRKSSASCSFVISRRYGGVDSTPPSDRIDTHRL